MNNNSCIFCGTPKWRCGTTECLNESGTFITSTECDKTRFRNSFLEASDEIQRLRGIVQELTNALAGCLGLLVKSTDTQQDIAKQHGLLALPVVKMATEAYRRGQGVYDEQNW